MPLFISVASINSDVTGNGYLVKLPSGQGWSSHYFFCAVLSWEGLGMSTNKHGDEMGYFIVRLRGTLNYEVHLWIWHLNWINLFEMCPSFTRACISRACGVFMVLSAVRHRNLSPLAGHQMPAGNEAQQQQTWVRFTEVVTCAATGRDSSDSNDFSKSDL